MKGQKKNPSAEGFQLRTGTRASTSPAHIMPQKVVAVNDADDLDYDPLFVDHDVEDWTADWADVPEDEPESYGSEWAHADERIDRMRGT